MRTPRRLQAGALFALVCVLSLAAAPTRSESQVTGRYATGDRVRNVYFDPSVPTGKFRNAIANAAANWNKLPGVARFEVHKSPSMGLSPDPCASQNGVPIGGVLRGPVAGALLAYNRSCIDPDTGRLIGFRQTYNTRFKFHTGSGDPPRKKYDLESVATHELGHSEGWYGDHYAGRNNSGLCADKSKQATMCPTIYPGSKRLHTLTKNDKQPVVASYSQPPVAPVTLDAGALAFSSAVAPGGAGARGCLAGLVRLVKQRRGGDQFADRSPQGIGVGLGRLGGSGAQRVNLGGGADLGLGKDGDDCIVGGRGPDDLRGEAGHDTIVAGPGADFIVGGPGSDLILAGLGADQIYAADGFFDRIRCGRDAEQDRVFLADPADVLVNCEAPPSAFAAIPLPPSY